MLENKGDKILPCFRPLVSGEFLPVELILRHAPSGQVRTHGREDQVHVEMFGHDGDPEPPNQLEQIMWRGYVVEQAAPWSQILLFDPADGGGITAPQLGQ